MKKWIYTIISIILIVSSIVALIVGAVPSIWGLIGILLLAKAIKLFRQEGYGIWKKSQ